MTLQRYAEDPRPKWLRWFLFEQPLSASGEWWDKRDEMLIRRAPIRYFLQHDLPITLRVQVRRMNDLWWKVRHRTTHRYHVVNTRLKPGYYEMNQRLLHASFSLLVDHVEISLASKNFDCKIKDRALRGLDYLDWEINDPQCAGPQADEAKIVKDLYLWWTAERTERLDPWSAPEIWGDREEEETPKPSFFRRRRRFKLGTRSRKQIDGGDMAMRLEEFYSDQDTSMLVRLAELKLYS